MKDLTLADAIRAYELIKEKHIDIRKGSNEPYYNHPLRVGNMAYMLTKDMTLAIAGYCHDLLEDTDYTFKDLEREFGEEVAYIVKGLTYRKEEHPLTVDKTDYIINLLTNGHPREIILKWCDRVDNIESLDVESDDKKFKSFRKYYIRKTKEILTIMTAPCREHDVIVKYLIDRLVFKINVLESKYGIKENDRNEK